MAKLDWLFLPVDFDDDDGEDSPRRPRIRALNRLHPRANPTETRSKAGSRFKRTPGSQRHRSKRSLKKQH